MKETTKNANNTPLDNSWDTEKIEGRVKKTLESNNI